MTRALTIVVVAAAIAGAVACSAQKMTRDQAAVGAGPLPPVSDLHAEIEALDQQIAADRQRLGTDAPDGAAVAAAHTMATGHAADVCTPSTTDTCADACRLSDSICDSASKICGLADQLPGDAWAADKCDAGKASCQVAITRCCGCDH